MRRTYQVLWSLHDQSPAENGLSTQNFPTPERAVAFADRLQADHGDAITLLEIATLDPEGVELASRMLI